MPNGRDNNFSDGPFGRDRTNRDWDGRDTDGRDWDDRDWNGRDRDDRDWDGRDRDGRDRDDRDKDGRDRGRRDRYDRRPPYGYPDFRRGRSRYDRPDFSRRPSQREMPSGPPPSQVPSRDQRGPGLYRVDRGAIRYCRYRYTYIWLENGRSFWTWLTYIGRNSVAGFRWTGYGWAYFGTDLDNISDFECY